MYIYYIYYIYYITIYYHILPSDNETWTEPAQALDLAELCGLLVALVSLFTDGRGGRSGQAGDPWDFLGHFKMDCLF